jgi:uncharacterized protein YodC (DUF2158 family)
METKIKSGDCVQLKHGGANIKMTVDLVFTYQGVPRCTCKYFNSEKKGFEEINVNADALKLCDESTPLPR